ncbi:cytochrome P450 [Pluteus cervinus]|uniref:Cytochrome P450 n=1 Tax=Pluteus cervinus TaxID=181527 RepID=A0ACD3BC83_9AGAR|nr:cytochrome P450 [Pluteus cervinus]
MKWAKLRKMMPPGPLGVPWIGNKHQLPAVKPWRKFAEWNKEYGPVVSIHLGTTPVILLGTAQGAWDLLEKRSDIYSSRPRFIMSGEILSDNMRGLMLPNNDRWRRWRKLLHTGFHSKRADTYRDIQSLESTIMMHQMLNTPRYYERHLQRYAASVVTSVTYGRRVDSVDEWVVKENMEAMDYLTSVNIPGKYLVESWPWLLKLPRSLQWFRREPEARKQRDINFLMHLLNDVKTRMQDGTVPDCLTSQSITDINKLGMSEVELAYAVSSPFGAGIETTAGTLTTFILAMLHFPGAMRKAQAEIDRVVGPDRIPEFDDKENLPYIKALVNETLRWRPVAVLGGSPHAVTADDVYQGMFIPKGSTIFANLAGIMHDPEIFPSPDSFLPERFLETLNPRLQTFELPFGFGRRICPGMHLALNSIFINVARILWGFDILPSETGDLPDSWNYTNGFNSRPVSFDCRLVPRNDRTVATIEAEWQNAQSKLRAWK